MKKTQNSTKKGHKILRRTLTVFGILILLLPLVGVSAFLVYYNSLDYSMDESLFEMAKGSRTTRFFYNAKSEENALSPSGAYSSENDILNGYTAAELRNEQINGGEKSVWCPLERIPLHLQNAFIAIEDKRFYTHDGVDVKRTAAAVLNYFLGFDGRFGGSSITQQLIKNISSDNEVSAARKLREICRALRLESRHSKEEILELYLNIVPLAEGCVGVGAASRFYYGKEPSDLSLAEAASVAAITNSPVRYDPYKNPENNLARRSLILAEMYSQGFITEEEYRSACGEELVLCPLTSKSEQVYSWYTETVLSDVIRDLEEEKGVSHETAVWLTTHGGLSVYTLMDFEVQQTLDEYFEDISHLPNACRGGMQMALAVIDPQTGALLGTVGGVGEKQGNRTLNYATALRAPGSVIKPLSVYAPALEEGVITYASVFDDVPLRFIGEGSATVAWPKNSPAVYSGLTDLPRAVAYSKNTVAIRVLEELGAEHSYAYLANRLSITSLVRGRYTDDGRKLTDLAAAPLALGQLTDGASLYELTAAYGALANAGRFCAPRSYALVLDRNGEVLLENPVSEKRVFSESTAYLTTELLRGTVEYGTATEIRLDEQTDLAGKTGTSGEGRDKWFIGYTPYCVCGIWCGYPDGNTPVPTEKRTHLAIWDEVMTKIHRILADDGEERTFSVPRDIVRAAYCRDSGCIPCEACRLDVRGDRIAVGLFRRGSEPHELCTCHTVVEYDKEGGGIARADCPDSSRTRVALLAVEGRDFPMQVYVEDAQYTVPTVTEEGHFTGISRIRTAPFNALCTKEHEKEEEEKTLPPIPWFRRKFFGISREKST